MKRNVFNGSFLLLIFLSIVIGIFVSLLFAKTVPLFTANTVYFCQKYLLNTFFQIPRLLPGILFFAVSSALFMGILSLTTQMYKTKLLVTKLLTKRVPFSPKVRNITTKLNIYGKLDIVKDSNAFSFCYGIFSPRIIATTTITNLLNEKELEAVFLHEKAHMQNFDPLKILIGKTISWIFFFLPIFSEVNDHMNTSNEILADRFVTDMQQKKKYLQGALKKILHVSSPISLATVPAIANPTHLEIRIRRFVNPVGKHYLKISWINSISTIMFIIASMVFLQTSVSAFQTEHSAEPSYFMCSSNNTCQKECSYSAQTSNFTKPQEIFSPFTENALSSSSQNKMYK